MPPKNNPFIRFLWDFHLWIYRLTGGRIGARLLAMPVLLLTTTGRKSGKERINPLSYVRHGDAFLVAASNGGADVPPGWYFNLAAHPAAQIQVGTRRMAVRARETAGAERDALWEKFKAMESAYARYETRTERLIPVMALEPVGEE
jgi:deazaflavin-dependent oxidoreductase (nitroreductase family)